MLSLLHIENIAVIERVDIQFDNGLNVLTGETGAGKSIIIDAINMVLGERTSRDLVRKGSKSAYVSALFSGLKDDLAAILTDLGIDLPDFEILFERELSSEGRSVCRINGRPVTISQLKEAAARIINIHGQQDTYLLMRPDRHITMLDKYASSAYLFDTYRPMYERVKHIKNEIDSISTNEAEKARRIDLLTYQIDEIKKAALKVGEDEQLQRQRSIVSNSQKILEALSQSSQLIYQGSDTTPSAHDLISSACEHLALAEKYDESLSDCRQTLENIKYQLDDCYEILRDRQNDSEYSSIDIDAIEARLDLIYRLKRKYGNSIEEILAYCEKISDELDNINSQEETILKLNAELGSIMPKLMKIADDISALRSKAAYELEKRIMQELSYLDMDRVIFKVQIQRLTDKDMNPVFLADGCDSVEFLICTNPGEDLKPLAKIASGGELSRIMLAINNVLSSQDDISTLIFDEIDSGVSGRAASKIAKKLVEISRSKQVLCVTHLAQIAAGADHHYLIEKNVSDGRTSTSVLKLEGHDRQNEIARIIGGELITEVTLQNAKQLLDDNIKYKSEEKANGSIQRT